MTTQIQVKKTTRYELQEQKEFSRQTYDDVIMRMIKDQKRKTKRG